ncbi:Tumor protein p53-inducible protein 11 [Trichinella pseudospiralis]|uniref:Tumor protein p53-inducible protein 11 n=1 Tax=Trichinella pseudospiralis TaxID=6337 RepID=A0A0V1G5E8_TRIPS|nr:Tumor protein p53-inducible protein 11 [Trichinella pseudospiralis]
MFLERVRMFFRKESLRDLQSRLKTRKVLGVGEIRNEGDVYRSKISQVLGYWIPAQSQLPRGLQFCHYFTLFYLFSSGILLIKHAILGYCKSNTEFCCQNENVAIIATAYFMIAIQYGALAVSEESSSVINGLVSFCLFVLLQACVEAAYWRPFSERGMLETYNIFLKYASFLLNLAYYQCTKPNSCMHVLYRVVQQAQLRLQEETAFVDKEAENNNHAQDEQTTATNENEADRKNN